MALHRGREVYIQYGGADLYHRRHLCAHISGARWVILTPDGDVYAETLSRDNADVTDIRVVGPRGEMPRGLTGANVYNFGEPLERGELEQIYREAADMASLEAGVGGRARILGIRPPGAVAVPGGAGLAGEEPVWLAEETGEGVEPGDEIEAPDPQYMVGQRALVPWGGSSILLRQVRHDEKVNEQERLRKAARRDVRTLPVLERNGESNRTWQQALDASKEEQMTVWPLSGPRTAGWLMRHIQRNGGAPQPFLSRAMRDLKLQENDRNGHELEVLLNVMDLAATADQYDITNSAAMELCARRVQLVLEAAAGGSWDGSDHFLGLGKRARGIAPELQSHVAKELKAEAEISRQKDKAKEIRDKTKTPGKAGGKGE
eukprot:6492296-Amphidinium_carterae.1